MTDLVARSLPAGFRKLDPTAKPSPRLIVAVSSLEKRGKTHFACTAPDPIAYFDLDIGTEGVVEKFVRAGKDIHLKDYNLQALKDIRNPGPTNVTKFAEIWEQFKSDFVAVMDSKVQSVVVDTATEVWELVRMARFGKLDHVKPHHYGPINEEYRQLLRQAYLSTKNLILLHKMKKEYVDDKSTGKYERAGFGDTGFLVQINVRCWRDKEGVFGLTVEDCRQNADIAGMELTGEMCSFPMLAGMVNGQ